MFRVGHWDDDNLPLASPGNLNVQYSGCWGIAVNGQEYAIVGGARHVLIFDITDPVHPSLKAKFEGKSEVVSREFKSYGNRVYGVSDGTTEGLMIFDFSQAPDTIIRSYYSNALFASAHTISLDTASGRIYLNGSDIAKNGLAVLDIHDNPDTPAVLSVIKNLPGAYTHDSYVRGDTVYASCGFNGYYIYDFSDPTVPHVLASLPPDGGYQHNSWLSADGHFAFCTEEIPSGRPIHIVDLRDLANANLETTGTFLDPMLPDGPEKAIPHNIYINGNLLFDSQYEDGLLVYDISNPLVPVLVAYYDTHPQNTQYNRYFGCWGNYPWLPSGTIIACDMQNGLQLLRLTYSDSPAQTLQIGIYPNPAREKLIIRRQSLATVLDSDLSLRIVTIDGRDLLEQRVQGGIPETVIELPALPAGLYLVEVRNSKGQSTAKKLVIY